MTGGGQNDRAGSDHGSAVQLHGKPENHPTPTAPRAYALNVRIGENRAITDTVPSSTWDWITWPISL